jgi:hypothetical protein
VNTPQDKIKLEKYIEKNLLLVSPILCDFKVGDTVSYTNQYNVVFEDLTVIGFSKLDEDSDGRFVHLTTDSYWFPVSPGCLASAGTPAVVRSELTRNLTLNNGQTAEFTHIDDWSRPNYTLENGVTVCCVDLDGTFLHTMSRDGEPDSPLKTEYQPISEALNEQAAPR